LKDSQREQVTSTRRSPLELDPPLLWTREAPSPQEALSSAELSIISSSIHLQNQNDAPVQNPYALISSPTRLRILHTRRIAERVHSAQSLEVCKPKEHKKDVAMKHDSELFLLRKACRSQEQICSQNCSLQIQELQRKEAIEATINYYSSFSSSSS
jgi:hypothetical protein